MAKLKLKAGKLYEVTWHDAYGNLGWQHPEDILRAGPHVCKTVGYFVGHNSVGDLVFASTVYENGVSFNHVAGRPKAMVKKIRKLK